MWAATPLHPRPPTAVSATNPLPHRRFTAIHNTQNPKSTQPLQHQTAVKSKTKAKPAVEEKAQGITERQLSGADVLMALQRAKSQKPKRKQDNIRVSESRNSKEGDNRGVSVFGDVRPLCIKPEWSDRLEELERRLEQLVHT